MEKAATQQAQQTATEAVERKLAELTKGEGIPSNVEIDEQLKSLKLGPEVDCQRLSETGQEVRRSEVRGTGPGLLRGMIESIDPGFNTAIHPPTHS